ncbi:dienelactone hydrolase family protein [Kitasatospora camelliae]|uniref:Dienelactone hydrolase family protein n=1 Tax=Kitasatospora camelliae TaxID=3156397 RepID=A0AAU8JR09_9ACTN
MSGSAQHVTFPGDGQTAHGYLVLPPQAVGPGLVVVPGQQGLTGHIRAMADRFAEEGFVALAPDLPSGAPADGELPPEQAVVDLRGAVDFLLGHPQVVGDSVGAVGFCRGGGLSLVLAAQEGDRVAAVVPFYGLPADDLFEYRGLTAHVLGHYAEEDDANPVTAVDEAAIRIGEATDRRPEIHFYPAGHAFMNEENPAGAYDALQARTAWLRTLSFLWAHLG